MKLEPKYLAPYLLYKLYVSMVFEPETILPICGLKNDIVYIWDGYSLTVRYDQIKPILRPLSDLTKTLFQFEYGEPTTLEDWINGNYDLGQLRWVLQDKAKEQRQERIMDLPYFVAEYLFKYNFDVFGLIDAGLAIDINTLKL